jgi:Amt family ammonium transporter
MTVLFRREYLFRAFLRADWRTHAHTTHRWEVLVYYPVAHSIWGGGLLAQLGVQDFAGGITIHTTAGTAAVIASYLLGQRPGFDKYEVGFVNVAINAE